MLDAVAKRRSIRPVPVLGAVLAFGVESAAPARMVMRERRLIVGRVRDAAIGCVLWQRRSHLTTPIGSVRTAAAAGGTAGVAPVTTMRRNPRTGRNDRSRTRQASGQPSI